MQIDTQDFIQLMEDAGEVVIYDTEMTGLGGNYNSVLCGSFKPYKQKPYTFQTKRPGDDKEVCKQIAEELSQYKLWVTFNGKSFDMKFINTRLIYWGLPVLERSHHLDILLVARRHLKMRGKSQAALLGWLESEQQKMDVPPNYWNAVLSNPKKYMPIMVKRCESDTKGLEKLYDQFKHLAASIGK